MNEPARFPNKNPMVQHLLEVQRLNAERGAPAGRSYTGGAPIDAGVPSRVSSAAMNVEQPAAPVPLSPEERAERDRLAREAGILPKEDTDNEAYADLDSALAAAAPVERAKDVMALRHASIAGMKDYQAIPVMPFPLRESRSKLIDFKRLQTIDLVRGVAIVDDIEISLPADELRQMKKRVLELAVDHVTRQLAEALHEVLQDGMDGEEGVQGVPAREAGRAVSSGQSAEGRPTEQVQAVRSEAGAGLESREETRNPDEGSTPAGGAAQ